jgi:hypothetical protein
MKENIILLFILAGCLATTNVTNAQISRINQTISPLEAESHLRFLTADELKGRNTGSSELLIAGRYIAEQFRRSGLIPMGDVEGDYLQRVPLHLTIPSSEAIVSILGHEFTAGQDLGILNGGNTQLEAPSIFMADLQDYESVDLKGKVVITVLKDPQSAASSPEQIKLLQDAGAIGVVQLFGPGQRFPWPLVLNFLNRERMGVGGIEEEAEGIPHIWVSDPENIYFEQLKTKPSNRVAISIKGMKKTMVNAFNVVGKIEGTDPKLKKEHIVMCAHYDLVCIQSSEDGQDSIYNGTRDNGIGTTGLINAAKYFGQYPPKRSVIIIALTGEEKGLLGSQYYVNNPKVPLEETVFAFNIDNSGYTNTEELTLLDTNRTNIDKLVYQAAAEAGLGVMGDRIPNQNYYERSDQVSFAAKGVPAVNFKMSMNAFDERISKYYHQPSDEFHTVDLEYIHKYWKAYIRSAELIGNWKKRPYWIKGDKFEPMGDKLYKKK